MELYEQTRREYEQVRAAQPTRSAALSPPCRHCRIFFLTHPRNAGRSDLRCPFGCREAHRKRGSTERSVAYYATAEGKAKKKMQNGKRAQGGVRADAHPPAPAALEFPAGMVGYVAMVAQGRNSGHGC